MQTNEKEIILELDSGKGDRLAVVAFPDKTYRITRNGIDMGRAFADLKECLAGLQGLIQPRSY